LASGYIGITEAARYLDLSPKTLRRRITTTAGTESPTGTEDIVYVARSSDLLLYEGGIRARVLPETKASNLTVVLQVYSYVAFTAGRYPQSVVEITGLTAPTF
jgi:hypothetical protein